MKGVVRQTVSLVLLLTQVAATVAGTAFTLCVSPKGRVCIEAPWTTCTCCQDERVADQDDPCRGDAGGDDKVCESEHLCSCRCDRDDRPPAATYAVPTDPDSIISHGQPCRCKRIPLIVAKDVQPTVERATAADRHALDQLVPAPAFSQFFCFSQSQRAVTLLSLPPPSGHLLAISCAVLRC